VKRTVFVLALLAPLMSSVCSAQTSPSTAEQTFQRLGERLDEAQQLLSGQISQTSGMVPSGAITQTINALESIVLEFRDNNWVRVKGFKVKVGLPPSIDIDLEIPSSSGSH
jgi:Fe-S cluster assembly scaffold protein SufB